MSRYGDDDALRDAIRAAIRANAAFANGGRIDCASLGSYTDVRALKGTYNGRLYDRVVEYASDLVVPDWRNGFERADGATSDSDDDDDDDALRDAIRAAIRANPAFASGGRVDCGSIGNDDGVLALKGTYSGRLYDRVVEYASDLVVPDRQNGFERANGATDETDDDEEDDMMDEAGRAGLRLALLNNETLREGRTLSLSELGEDANVRQVRRRYPTFRLKQLVEHCAADLVFIGDGVSLPIGVITSRPELRQAARNSTNAARFTPVPVPAPALTPTLTPAAVRAPAHVAVHVPTPAAAHAAALVAPLREPPLLINTVPAAREAVLELHRTFSAAAGVALDIEFDGQATMVVQLCYSTHPSAAPAARRTLIIDVGGASPTSAARSLIVDTGLKQLLEDTAVVKVLHSAGQDLTHLRDGFGVALDPYFDTQAAHQRLRPVAGAVLVGLNDMLAAWGQFRNDHNEAMQQRMRTDAALWRRRPLDQQTIDYCALDVWPLLGAYAAMREQHASDALWPALVVRGQPPRAGTIVIGTRPQSGAAVVGTRPESGAAQNAAMVPWVVRERGHRTVVFGADGAHHDLLADEQLLLAVLPPRVADWLRRRGDRYLSQVVDVALDVGRPVQVKVTVPVPQELGAGASAVRRFRIDLIEGTETTEDDVADVVAAVGRPVDAQHRIVLHGTLHRLGVLRDAVEAGTIGLTCRFGRAYGGLAETLARDVLQRIRDHNHSLLIVGAPGSGKTSTLRDLIRCLASPPNALSLMVVDQSQEIGGGGIRPHPSIGNARRLLVPPGTKQAAAMLEAIVNHTPEVLVVDEIGTQAEATICQNSSERGVSIIATVHGNTLWSVLNNRDVNGVLGGVSEVILGDMEARRSVSALDAAAGAPLTKVRREAARPPAFQEIIVLDTWDSWTVIPSATQATICSALRGDPVAAFQRRRLANGDIEEREIELVETPTARA